MTLPSFPTGISRGPLFSAIAAGLLLTACAAPEVPPPSEEELTGLAHSVLEEAVYTGGILRECGGVGPQLKQHSEDLTLLWLDQHGDALAGADAQYTRSLEEESFEYRGKTLALAAIELSHEARRRAREELRLSGRSLNNQRIVCERRLNQLEEDLGKRPYLDRDSEREKLALRALEAYPSERTDLDGLPSLGGAVPMGMAPGRSYHRLEEQVRRECTESRFTVIENEWPREAYGVFCEGEPYQVIACEWGECREL